MNYSDIYLLSDNLNLFNKLHGYRQISNSHLLDFGVLMPLKSIQAKNFEVNNKLK